MEKDNKKKTIFTPNIQTTMAYKEMRRYVKNYEGIQKMCPDGKCLRSVIKQRCVTINSFAGNKAAAPKYDMDKIDFDFIVAHWSPDNIWYADIY